ncbi:dynamin family protein [Undibacterium seohonense]|uniref:Dynamin family protein n=1 Tax=Undibacterium seohonense TaxID=1344950 RepID=A0ABR6WZ25_9BURK|nr:dynamin family protein [Undibacterium seohonense]MBC3805800.1 dynamin family protein [Undibacterium seohonense]
MLSTQTKLINYIKSVQQEIKASATEIAHPSIDKICADVSSQTETQIEVISETKLLVPVIGAFSAGKSSLLNAFMERSHLPVAITPETALATELHYSKEEVIEACGIDNRIHKFQLQEFAQITARAQEFQYLRAYINSPSLQSIQPLILVDMPGFDSPLDAHNQAINFFLSRGTHFVFLTSVEEGGLHRHALRQMREILDLSRRFSVCLSKSDLKPESQVNEIVAHIEDQITNEFGSNFGVITLNQYNAQQQLSKLVEDIDPEFVTANLHIPHLKKAYYETNAALVAIANSLGKSKQEINEKLEAIKNDLNNLEDERKRQLQEISGPDANDLALPVMNALKAALQNSTSELVEAAMRNPRDLELELNELVRSTMNREVLLATEAFSTNTVQRFEKFAQDHLKVDFQIPTDVIQIGLDAIKSPLLGAIAKQLGGKASKKMATVAMRTIGVGVSIANPIVGIVTALLPDLVESLFGTIKTNRQREAIKMSLQSDLFAQVISQMKIKVTEHMSQVAQSVVETISHEFSQRLENERSIYELQENQHQEELAVLEAKTQRIKKTNVNLLKLASGVIIDSAI